MGILQIWRGQWVWSLIAVVGDDVYGAEVTDMSVGAVFVSCGRRVEETRDGPHRKSWSWYAASKTITWSEDGFGVLYKRKGILFERSLLHHGLSTLLCCQGGGWVGARW